jgi:hypothetical protein
MSLADTRAARLHLRALLDSFSRHIPPVRIVKKSACWHQRAAALALQILTLGGQRTYLTHYVTTLGHIIYVPDDFDDWPPSRACEVLRHEAVHVAQFERFGWLLMILVYGILPLPMGLAYGRARLEWEAYAETLRAVAEIEGIEAARSPALRAEILRRFTGPDYGWMWPFPNMVSRWIDETLEAIGRDHSARLKCASKKDTDGPSKSATTQ